MPSYKKNYVPVDIFYNMVAQKVGAGASPTMARKYCEALQSVTYSLLQENNFCNWYGFGTFSKVFNKATGKHKKMYNLATSRTEVVFIPPSYKIVFKPVGVIKDAINGEEVDFKKIKTGRKRIYKNDKERLEIKKKEKIIQKTDDWVDGLILGIKQTHKKRKTSESQTTDDTEE